MQEVFENMVLLREEIQENQKLIKEKRALLKDLTVFNGDAVHDRSRPGPHRERGWAIHCVLAQLVSVCHPCQMEFVQACLTEYIVSAGNNANATEAMAAFVFEQRKAQKQAVARIQVRLQKNIVLQSGSVGLEERRQPQPPPSDVCTRVQWKRTTCVFVCEIFM